jgi:TonB-dependent receptor
MILATTSPRRQAPALTFIVLPFFLLAAAPAAAQGLVEGRVLDPDGRPLAGAAVSVGASSLAASTDGSGRYRLPRLPAGSRTLRFSYLGFADATREVEVPASGSLPLDVTLDRVVASDSVVVLAEPIREGTARALNQQRTAVNIQNIVAADQMGRFPDPNAAEATQRIPGITVQRDQGEGRYVVVRGTEPRLNAMTLNGERIPSTEGDIRNVALDVVPADLLQAIEVSKALTPDMEGDAIGGAVNLVTKKAPEGEHFGASLGYGHNELSGKPIYTGNALYGRRQEDGPGLLVAVTAMETQRATDNFEVEYDDGELETLELRDYSVTRERYGLNLDYDRDLSETSELRLHGVINEFGDQEFRRAVVNAVDDGEISRELKDRYEVQSIRSLALEGSTLVADHGLFDYRLAYSSGEEREPDGVDSAYLLEDVEFAPSASDPDDIQANPVNEDFDAYELDEVVYYDNRVKEEDVVAALNGTFFFYRDERLSGSWKAGLKYRSKDKQRENSLFEVEVDDPGFLAVRDARDGRRLFGGRYQVGPFHDAYTFRRLAESGELEADPEEDLADYDAQEDTIAGYALGELRLGDHLTTLFGVRYENTDADYLAYRLTFDEDGDFAGIEPTTGSQSTGELLPSVHLRWAMSEKSNLRAAVTRSLARPNFFDLAPYELVLEEDGEIERGNPSLELTTAWNFDLLYERYLEPLGVVSAGFFHKKIENGIFPFRFEEERDGEDFDVLQPRNGGDAELSGLELAWQNQFASGFGIYFNYTFTDSEVELLEREDKPRLPGQAESVGNFALAYEKSGFSARLSFNYHGEYLIEVGEEEGEDLFVKERLQIDLAASWQVARRWRLFLELVNIGDEPYEVYEGTPDQPIQVEQYSWWATLGMKLDF